MGSPLGPGLPGDERDVGSPTRRRVVSKYETRLDDRQAEAMLFRMGKDQGGAFHCEPRVLGVGARLPHESTFDQLGPVPIFLGQLFVFDSV